MKSVTLDPGLVELFPRRASRCRGGRRAATRSATSARQRYDRLRIAPLRLPQQAWKTVRLDNGAVRKTFGDPERATASRPTAHSVTRDEGGVLVRTRARTGSARSRRLSAMSPSAAEMATLTYYAGVPEAAAPAMLLELINLTWRPIKLTLPRRRISRR